MKNMELIIAISLGLLIVMGPGWQISTPENQPLKVKIVNPPNPDPEARIKALEAKVEHLEGWAAKVGGRIK